MSIYSHKSKKDSLWLHFTASKIVTPLKRLAVGWKPITSTIVFMITGVEMEALTAASVAALTIYDMCKAVQKDMVI